ncbi:hypothetical protein H2198_002874 [Neophaeococcomyces mojaviensis]|uniref:Uncharacterized protein n=1 Tax=Neophaeococcomyces mojaviensis TaxID=3383035 RepID=A0ACC3ACR7_9EURO|nr:hypothetical protein H2198_002874 [Knufia sp. JES_112]
MNSRTSAPIRRVIRGTKYRANPSPWTRVELNPHIAALLSQPSWSVRSLLPSEEAASTSEISRKQLHHLLKLSALPVPTTQEAEDRMLKTLQSQIHFVKEVQKVDTTGLQPLVAIRDETHDAIREQMFTLEKLQPWLDIEKTVGTNGTIRRQKSKEMIKGSGWDPFDMGKGKETRKMGKYFFVKKNKDVEQAK